MSPDYMQHTLHLMAGRGLIDLRATAARARGVDDACTVGDPTGQPSANPGETQRVPNSTESGTSPENGTGPKTGTLLEFGVVPGSGRVYRSEWCATCTPSADDWPPPDGSAPGPGLVDDACLAPDVTHRHAASRSDSVTSRDPAATLSPSLWQSLAGSLPHTLHQESEPMNAKPLQPTVTLDGQPAAGEAIIRQLIKELGHCQEQLAACLPDAVGARRAAETGNPASSHVDDEAQAGDRRAPAASAGAVHDLVSSALQAHDHHLVLLQAESTQLRVQIEQVTARRREFMDFLQTGVARP